MKDNPADALIDEAYLADSAAAVGYVRALGLGILREMGLWQGAPGEARPLGEVARRLGVGPEQEFALAWLLEEAREAGGVEVTLGQADPGEDATAAGEAARYRPLAPPAADALERAAERLAEHAAGVGSSKPELDHVASRYPEFLRGERSGPAILLKGPALELWSRYFSAENPLYDVHNALGAVGVERALADLGRPARVVELGAGTGGATDAILGRLGGADGRIASLTITDVAPSFLVATLERLRQAHGDPGFPVERRRLDFNRPPAQQGLTPDEVDVLVGVNALHNGPDLARTLSVLHDALPRHGVLVVSESLCQIGQHVHQDFVFNLLPLDRPRGRRGEGAGIHSRFYSAAVWSRALAGAGFDAEIHVNARGPELALLAVARRAG